MKPIPEWSVTETLEYLRNSKGTKDQFTLTRACRYLTQLATKGVFFLKPAQKFIIFGCLRICC